MNTSLRIVSPFYSRLRVSAWPALLRTLFACGNPRGQERAIFDLTSSHAHLREQYVECWAQYRLQHPVTLRNALRQLLAAARYHASKVKPSIPILLLGGAGDRLVNPNCSVRLAKVWRAPLHFHPSAGHDLPLDDGIWVARKVAAWRSGGRPR